VQQAMSRRSSARWLRAVATAACALVIAISAGGPARAAVVTRSALHHLRASGAIDRPAYERARTAYDRAVATVDRLRGARQHELRGAIADIDGIARRGQLTAGRLRAVRLTLDHNRRWWSRRPLLRPGARVQFGHSEVLWQHYAGSGLQIQWLATFGKANSLWRQHLYTRLRRLLDEALELAVHRGPGIAWESLFTYAGSRPPWVSGLSQGTALTALTRAGRTLDRRRYRQAAHAALGIFRVAPPVGVRVRTAAGAHYLQYSGNPRLRVLNGFVQSLNGLSDLSRAAHGRTKARWLLERGDAEALVELPRYVKDGWSRYSRPGGLSTVGYQRLLRDFVRGRCDRGGNHRYCVYASRLQTQLRRPPRLRIVGPRRPPRQAHPQRLRFTVDKPASATLTIRGRHFRHVVRTSVTRGTQTVRWRPPHAGPYRAEVVAVDLAGNHRARTAMLHVRP
jgi:hypothetical protein